MRKFMKKASTILLAGMLAVTGVVMTGCSSKGNSDQVVIDSNADDEAVEAMKKTLDDNGYRGKYVSA